MSAGRALLATAATAGAMWLAVVLATLAPSPATDSATGYPSPNPPGSPSGIPSRIAPWSAVPRAGGLAPLVAALDTRDASGLARTIGPARLDVGPPGASEGWGMSMSPQEAEVALATLFAAGARPVVRGVFAPGAAGNTAAGDTAAGDTAASDDTADDTANDRAAGEVVVVLTGLDAGPTPPTLSLALGADGRRDPLGEPAPSALPLGAAAWHVLADGVGGGRWQRWSAAEDYDGLVAALWRSGLGTYWILEDE